MPSALAKTDRLFRVDSSTSPDRSEWLLPGYGSDQPVDGRTRPVKVRGHLTLSARSNRG